MNYRDLTIEDINNLIDIVCSIRWYNNGLNEITGTVRGVFDDGSILLEIVSGGYVFKEVYPASQLRLIRPL